MLSRIPRLQIGWRAAVVVGLLAAIVGACAAPPPTATPSPTPTPPVELDETIGEWRLETGTIDGRPVPMVDQAPITLTVNAVRIGGTSACNSYGADWVFTDDGPRPGDIAQTLMLCEDPIQLSEVTYLQALARVTDFDLGRRPTGVQRRGCRTALQPSRGLARRLGLTL
jgi:heat shock protein HslJ